MEIPTSTHPGLISKSQTEEKARFITAVSKIHPVVNLIKKMYGKSRLMKFIRTDYSTYKMTQSPLVILDNIKINHPLIKLMNDYVKKLEDSSKFFMILVGNILEEVMAVLDRGVKAPTLSEILHEVSSEIFDLTKDLCDDFELIKNGQVDKKVLSKVLECLIKEEIPRNLLVEAIVSTKRFSTENIRIIKVSSGSLEDSRVVNGMVFEREPEGKIKKIEDGTTCIYNASIDVPRGELKSIVQLESAEQLKSFSKDEVVAMEKKVKNLSSDVILFSGKINEIYLDFLDKANKLVFKVLSKHDLRRLRELLGGTISQEFGEDVEKGRVKEINVINLGNKKYTQFVCDISNNMNINNMNNNNMNINNSSNVCSLILRHPLEYRLDELERTINKSLVALQRNVKDKKIKLCPGSGQFEVKLGEIFKKLAKDSLMKYNEGEDVLERHLVLESLSNAFKGFKNGSEENYDLYATKVRAVCYALEFVGTVFEIEDYLIGIPPKLNVRPQMNQNWDEDH